MMIFEAIVTINVLLAPIMESAPWKIFHTKEGDLVIDVDGKITVNGVTSAPFPTEISHAAMCDKGIVATWVDHELRLARMALLSTGEPIENGMSKAELRLNRNTLWSLVQPGVTSLMLNH